MTQTKFDFSVTSAGAPISISSIITVIGNPLFGLLVDRVKRRSFFTFIACIGQTLNFVFVVFLSEDTSATALWAFFVLGGLCTSLFITAYLLSINLVVPSSSPIFVVFINHSCPQPLLTKIKNSETYALVPSGLAATAFGVSFALQDTVLVTTIFGGSKDFTACFS